MRSIIRVNKLVHISCNCVRAFVSQLDYMYNLKLYKNDKKKTIIFKFKNTIKDYNKIC